MALRLVLAMLAALTVPGWAQSADLPEVPGTHVIDSSDSLGERRRNALEAELNRIRTVHQIDVHAVVWDRDLPEDGDLAALATRLGKQWSRDPQWLVVLQVPSAGGATVGAHGGFAAGGDSAAEDELLAAAFHRGQREWTSSSRFVESTLVGAQEFIFLKYARARALPPKAALPAESESPGASRILRLAAICALLLLLGLLYFAWSIYSRKPRKTAPPRFPETSWKRRFGAPWSGGSDLGATFPKPQP